MPGPGVIDGRENVVRAEAVVTTRPGTSVNMDPSVNVNEMHWLTKAVTRQQFSATLTLMSDIKLTIVPPQSERAIRRFFVAADTSCAIS